MKNLIILLVSSLMILSCAHTKKDRKVASVEMPDLDGFTTLGYSEYNASRKGPNRPANRIYFRQVPGAEDKYIVVLIEYLSMPKIFPRYALSSKFDFASNRGWLKYILKKIT